jgi:hypothetical protein
MIKKHPTREALCCYYFVRDEETRETTLENMARFGGSFVQQLAVLFRYADRDNTISLAIAFAKYIDEYAPDKWKKRKQN